MNKYYFSRCGPYENTFDITTRFGRTFEITASIPLIPARNAIHSEDDFISFAKALNKSERHRNFFMLGVTDMYVDINDSVGDIKLGLITYFQTGKNERHLGIQYAWMCMSKSKVCVVGLADDPVHAEKRMIRSAAGLLRERSKTHVKPRVDKEQNDSLRKNLINGNTVHLNRGQKLVKIITHF